MWVLIWGFIVAALPRLIGLIFLALGVSLVTYTGLDLAVTQLESSVTNLYNGIPSDMLSVLNLMGISTGLKILFSSYAFSMTIKTVSGATKRFKMGSSTPPPAA